MTQQPSKEPNARPNARPNSQLDTQPDIRSGKEPACKLFKPLSVAVAAATDTGQVRPQNEDAYLINHALGLFAVADGVGGHGGGSEASLICVNELPQVLRSALLNVNAEILSNSEIQNHLNDSIVAVNKRVFQAGAHMEVEGHMGTTLTGGLFLDSGIALIFNVGDSRTYVYRENRLSQITTDQSWYQSWLDSGRMGSEPPKNVILQGIGLDDDVVADWTVTACQANDLWLMCTDGLSDLLSDTEISNRIKHHIAVDEPLETLCAELISAANEAGGEDNITVLALQPKNYKTT